jgi:hypothetical protein
MAEESQYLVQAAPPAVTQGLDHAEVLLDHAEVLLLSSVSSNTT